jgi:NAD(P)-dependent dehydrogenase (short-subunit alcohol dehydrogenase family)
MDRPPATRYRRDALDWNGRVRAGKLFRVTTPHVALVTGAGRGIGAAIASKLAREGAAVLVAARSQEACMEIAQEIRESGGTAWPLHLDVGDPESIEIAVAEARELASDVGPIDWLVNNAGIAISAPFLEHGRKSGVDSYEQHLRINFHGPRRMCEMLIPAMIERKYGRVVHIASSAGMKGYAYAAAYTASKHALVGYGRSAAAELAKSGVTMNLVCPHYVDSPMTEQSIARVIAKTKKSEFEARAFFAAQNPGGTLVSVSEVADVVLELLSGDKNGSIAELVGGRPAVPREKAVIWR